MLRTATSAIALQEQQPTGIGQSDIATHCSLSGIQSSCHVGFYSNEQVICNLLHMAVQLALFRRPACTQHTEPPTEEEQRFLGWKADAEEQQGGAVSEACCQTESQVRPPKPEVLESKCVGVRIGGGYHLTRQEGPLETLRRERRQQDRMKVRSSSVGPAATDQNGTLEAAVHAGFGDHPYAHGAAPEDMPASRYRVGTYDPNENWQAPKAPQSKQCLSQSAHLYRVLKPVKHEVESGGTTESGHLASQHPLSQSQPRTFLASDLNVSQGTNSVKIESPEASTHEGDTPPSPRSQEESECDSGLDGYHHHGTTWRSPEEVAAAWCPDPALSVTMSPGRLRPRIPSGKPRPSSAGAVRKQAQDGSSARTHSIDNASKKEGDSTTRGRRRDSLQVRRRMSFG